MTWLYVCLFGVLGVCLRFGIDQLVSPRTTHFWFITLLINLLGSLALGFFIEMNQLKNPSFLPLKVGLLVGLCGGFTTFSTFSMNIFKLLENGETIKALSYGLA